MSHSTTSSEKKAKPPWMRAKLPTSPGYRKMRAIVEEHRLHTICQSGQCPNMGECWERGTATFMILGNVCTRSCGFCAVATGRPPVYDVTEPQRVAQAVKLMKVRHAVITSVNRDELKDRGAELWYQTVKAIQTLSPQTTIETLIPDVRGNWEALDRMISAGQEVVSHNIETVSRLYPSVRPQAQYARSLEQLLRIKRYGKRSKTGMMLGLGETNQEVLQLMDDLRKHEVDILTIGQYLQPTPKHLEVVEYIPPARFRALKEEGLNRGFKYIEAGPLVRSSYRAERQVT